MAKKIPAKKSVKKSTTKVALTKKIAVKKKASTPKVPAKKITKPAATPKKAAVKSASVKTTRSQSPLERGRILVTGGAGFIGSQLIAALNKRGFDNILVTDFLGHDQRFKNLVPLRFQEYLEADEFSELLAEAPELFNDVETVFHLGAISSTTETDARFLVQNNYAYTQSLAAWALAKGARFVYASSAATYGDGSQGMSDSASLHSLRPLNMYGYSKHLFDLYAQRSGWLPYIVGLKYFNVFGPNEAHKEDMRSMVAKSYQQICKNGFVNLFKSQRPDYAHGEQKRDFLYVKDAVDMTLHLAESPVATGLYNIGSGVASTWNALASAIFKALGKPAKIQYIDLPESLAKQYQYYTCADITRLRSTGYNAPVTTLSEAVEEYVNYLEKP